MGTHSTKLKIRQLTVSIVVLLGALAMILAGPLGAWAADHQYVEQSTLLVIYKSYINNEETKADGTHPQHAFTNAEVETFKQQPKIVSDLLWRASQFRFHMKYAKALVIEEPLTEADIAESWISAKRIAMDIGKHGYKDGDFGLIIVVWPLEGTDKYTSWAGGLPGATGGEIYLPKTRLDVSVYGRGRDISEAHWTILHEHQHVLDGFFADATGMAWYEQEYRNTDDAAWAMPWPVDNGGMACFLTTQEVSARKWEDWLLLGKPGVPIAGTIRTLPDADADGLPDSDPNKYGVPLTEATFGSDITKSDTDGDGVGDRDEAVGDHTGSYDPKSVDTDKDGMRDGVDFTPRYASINMIPPKTPTIDGKIDADEYERYSTFSKGLDISGTTYTAWNDGMLYLAASITDDKVVANKPKLEDNDGIQWLLDTDCDGWVRTKDLGMLDYKVWVTGGRGDSAIVNLYQHLETSGINDDHPLPITGVVSAYKMRADGYDVEIAIPESALIGVTFKRDHSFRMSQQILDVDGSGDAIQIDAALSNVAASYPMYAPYMMKVFLGGDMIILDDTTPPTPNPATFAVKPHWEGNKIVMMATTGTDESGPVEYCFVECWGREGRGVRGWSTDPSFEVKNPNPQEEYRYVVYMRDALGNTTHSEAGIVPPKTPRAEEE